MPPIGLIMAGALEKKRTSIARLKRWRFVFSAGCLSVDLKRKEPRLRDWNNRLIPGFIENAPRIDLKRKEPRLRDWNTIHTTLCKIFMNTRTWKEKNLDCEIETFSISETRIMTGRFAWKEKNLDCEIETRCGVSSPFAVLLSWKEKNLDCEIETMMVHCRSLNWQMLEKKRTSIARLKPLQLLHGSQNREHR